MPDAVKVLIVDDSAYMRVVLRDMLQSEQGILVVGTARDGVEAIEKVKALSPDVVLLDIQMPKMDGIAALQRIMKDHPTRVLMLSAMNKMDVQLPLRALEMGAVDFIPKPSGPVSIDIIRYRKSIVDMVKNAASARMDVLRSMRGTIRVEHLTVPKVHTSKPASKAVVFAASTGGPKSLEVVFASLPKGIPAPIYVVQHLPAEFSSSFASRLNSANGPEVLLAKDGDIAVPGNAYLAPGGLHLKLAPRNGDRVVLRLEDSEPVQFVRPSADVLLESAAKLYGSGLMAVIMTGMGADGARGARAVKAARGTVVVQDEATSVIFGMAKAVIAGGAADEVVPLGAIPRRVMQFIEG